MAQYANLKLSVDPETGERTLTIGYESDKDALPMEHEDAHRKLAIGVAGEDAVKSATRVSKSSGSSSGGDDGGLPQAIKQEG